MKRLNTALRGAVIGAALLFGGASQAANIVTNGGFETGTLAGWTQFGNTGFTGVDASSANSGAFGAYFGPVGSMGGIAQMLATTAGTEYSVEFWLRNTGGVPNEFEFNWDGGAAEASLVNAAVFGYTQYVYDLTASSASTQISFAFRQDPSYFFLDDVSVDANDVPEPGSVALLGLGIAGLTIARRKKFAAKM